MQPAEEIRSSAIISEPRTTDTQPSDAVHESPIPDESMKPLYVDMAAVLSGEVPALILPEVCRRGDGIGLFYRGQYNVVFGDPETGKTLLTDYATVQKLAAGGRVLRLDLDHNGPLPAGSRLITMGAPREVVTDQNRLRYVEPEDVANLLAIIADVADWRPTLVIIDSVGELVPMFGGNSNSADEFTNCHRRVIKPLVRTGACVVAIDHLAKGEASRSYGAGGTIAKKRAVGGVALRVTIDAAFTPGKGGSARLTINKDRHGGLRANCSVGNREPYAGKFILSPDGDSLRGEIRAPDPSVRIEQENSASAADIAAMDALNPPPTSARDARPRLGWNDKRTRTVFKVWVRQKNEKRWPTESAA
ncbi:AAA family ATPase [Nocardia sp. NEAU-351]|uniref:AAA family ATPase n=1 Tax=Nocardia bovistercoris TaxID=2785916 RepID=A0A931IKF8_9NOCA|nr:AAA family ATPase [Nocardia bovistercoris]MBH0781270.1 AAA family ATPase [Nocardia bovistercoris]